LSEIEQRDYPAAARWLEEARAMDCKHSQVLLLLELYCGAVLPEYDMLETAERILSRNDLPMNYTSLALGVKGDKLLEQGHWAEAEAIADRILVLEEKPYARSVKWITSLRRGDQAEAQRHISFTEKQMPKPLFHSDVAGGLLLLGRRTEAMEELRKAVAAGFRVFPTKSAISQLATSEDFAAYCRQQEDGACP